MGSEYPRALHRRITHCNQELGQFCISLYTRQKITALAKIAFIWYTTRLARQSKRDATHPSCNKQEKNIYKILSESDLLTLKDWYPELASENPALFNRILWDLGVDVHKEIETQEGLQHRNLQGQMVTCRRYVGFERQDRAWMLGGQVSQEMQYLSADSETRKDMRKMQNTTEYSAMHKLEEEHYKVIREQNDKNAIPNTSNPNQH